MDREQAKQYIQGRATDYLQRDKSGKGFICPICGNGSGKNRTGITTKDKIIILAGRGASRTQIL